jgi:hypothetical protein
LEIAAEDLIVLAYNYSSDQAILTKALEGLHWFANNKLPKLAAGALITKKIVAFLADIVAAHSSNTQIMCLCRLLS